MGRFRIQGKAAGNLLRGLLAAFLITVGLLLLTALILLKAQPELSAAKTGIMAVYPLACLAGGWVCGRRTERRKFLWGLVTGILYFLILLAVSGISDRGVQEGISHGLLVLVLCAVGGMAGGMIS